MKIKKNLTGGVVSASFGSAIASIYSKRKYAEVQKFTLKDKLIFILFFEHFCLPKLWLSSAVGHEGLGERYQTLNPGSQQGFTWGITSD